MRDKLLIFEDEKINLKTTKNILILIMIFSGIFGFIYETFFYKIYLGYFVKRGSTFGPWIPIYVFGGGLITIISYKFRKNPCLIFLIDCIITGIIEYGTGYVLYEYKGIRLWDYNTEIWNWGNINGYICLRSILFFGISSLFLIYVMIPIFLKLAIKVSEKKLTIISSILGILFILDILMYGIFVRLGPGILGTFSLCPFNTGYF